VSIRRLEPREATSRPAGVIGAVLLRSRRRPPRVGNVAAGQDLRAPPRSAAPTTLGPSSPSNCPLFSSSSFFARQALVLQAPVTAGGRGCRSGSTQATHAEPAGYTFVISGIASGMWIAPIINANTSTIRVKDFTHAPIWAGRRSYGGSTEARRVKDARRPDRLQRTGRALTYAVAGLSASPKLCHSLLAGCVSARTGGVR